MQGPTLLVLYALLYALEVQGLVEFSHSPPVGERWDQPPAASDPREFDLVQLRDTVPGRYIN